MLPAFKWTNNHNSIASPFRTDWTVFSGKSDAGSMALKSGEWDICCIRLVNAGTGEEKIAWMRIHVHICIQTLFQRVLLLPRTGRASLGGPGNSSRRNFGRRKFAYICICISFTHNSQTRKPTLTPDIIRSGAGKDYSGDPVMQGLGCCCFYSSHSVVLGYKLYVCIYSTGKDIAQK